MRYSRPVKHARRVLCVFPAYTPSFGTFAHAYALMPDVRAFMPPQGLLVITEYLPQRWQVRFIDENIAAARASDFAWADTVWISGMHIQAPQIQALASRAKAAGKITVLGGPSVSSSPEKYPQFDYVHLGELGDATDRLIERLDQSLEPPQAQVRFQTEERLPLTEFPLPAYEAVPIKRYLLGSMQFSSGCPYRCEFCDIPALYGRQPRMKSPAQILAELDRFIAQPNHPPMIYFVDDNFIANRKATREMLPHLVDWQRRRGYPLQFACEATLNLAKQTEILELMREAAFHTVFVGIETPELEALKSIDKGHNAKLPLIESIETLNRYGLEVTSGIIIGLDTDNQESQARLLEFIDRSQVPVLTINLLQALPRTPLWERLARDGRITDDPTLESNVRFNRPHDEVVGRWRGAIAHAYSPTHLFSRFHHQVLSTYIHRLRTPAKTKLTRANLRRGLILAGNILWRIGVVADYRAQFWRAARHAIRHGQLESVFGMGFVAYHLIRFTREALRGEHNASFYAAKARRVATRPGLGEPLTQK